MKQIYLLGVMLLGLYTYGQTDGSLDPAFATKGWTELNFLQKGNVSGEHAKQVLAQPDGKYILVLNVDAQTRLARYNTNGSLDFSFGVHGFSCLMNLAPASAVLSDGKIVVAGSALISRQAVAIARYTSDGAADTTFSTDGITVTDFAYDNVYAASLAIQTDGKIVVAGTAETTFEHNDFLIARYKSDGTLDSTFGENGKVVSDLGSWDDGAYSVAIQQDGNIVAAGSTINQDGSYDFAIVRYTTNGTLDNTFGTTGIVLTDFGGQEAPNAVVIQRIGTEDKIIAAGVRYELSSDPPLVGIALARYNSDGTLDSTFGTAGKVLTDLNSEEIATSVIIQRIGTDDKILVAGAKANKTTYRTDFALLRYTTSGTIDNTFGTGGSVTTGFPSDATAHAVAIDNDGKIVACGELSYPETNNDFALARYTANGVPDNSFGTSTSGTVIGYYPGELPSEFKSMAVQTDGKVVVAGNVINNQDKHDFGVARYNSDGTLDSTFGTAGVVSTDFSTYEVYVASTTIQSDGKIVVAGRAQQEGIDDSYFALARYNSDGTLDSTFGTAGKVLTNVTTVHDIPTALLIQHIGTENKILVVGYAEVRFEDNDILLVRYNSDGTLDNTFGTGGKIISGFGSDEMAAAAIIQTIGAEDKVVVAGSLSRASTGWDFLIARYNSDGTLDNTFGTGGKAALDISLTSDDASAVAIQKDNKIVVAGYTYNDQFWDFALARFNIDGTIDNTFGTVGFVTTRFETDAGPSAVAIQSDGKIIVSGGSMFSETYLMPALSRYMSDGTLDTSFGTSGKVVTDLDHSAYMNSAAWYNGRLYTAGSFSISSGVLAAYQASATAPALPVINITDVTVYESPNGTQDNTATLTVSLNKPATSLITVNYATQDVTAISKGKNPDYKATKGSVSILKGKTSATLTIVVYKDNLSTEGDETFNVNLNITKQMAKLATIGKGTAVVTIKNGTGTLGVSGDVVTKMDNAVQQETFTVRLSAIAYPNPSSGFFTLQLQGGSHTPATISVMDVLGREIETLRGVAAASIQIGIHYRPGIYYAHIVKGTESMTIKLIKK